MTGSEAISDTTMTGIANQRRHNNAMHNSNKMSITNGMKASVMNGAGKKDRGSNWPE
jgi:hypothetical protein